MRLIPGKILEMIIIYGVWQCLTRKTCLPFGRSQHEFFSNTCQRVEHHAFLLIRTLNKEVRGILKILFFDFNRGWSSLSYYLCGCNEEMWVDDDAAWSIHKWWLTVPKEVWWCRGYVFPVGGFWTWSCDVSISGSNEDVGVQLITLPDDTKRTRITNRLDNRIAIRMIMTGWNNDPTWTNDTWRRVNSESCRQVKKIRDANIGLGVLV